MSRIRANKITNKIGTGAVELEKGAHLPIGMGITGAGGVNITGVVTATSFSGNGTHTYDIPASMVGNAYHFVSGVYCGQNCNNSIQITLACSFNSANPP